MTVKTQFSIKDLENLSNVKAHTIRIWEKRYNLLQPNRTNTNIREYDLHNLKKLLNVTFLYNEGIKISKIAKLSEAEINQLVLDHGTTNTRGFAIKNFISAMLDFDATLFTRTFDSLSEKKSFRRIFFDVFLPLLDEIGILWQTGTIDPSHEHFISELVKQQVILKTEKVQRKKVKYDNVIFTLFLPFKEIHEIGLLYVNYELLNAGYKTIYLGNNIPLDSLKYVVKHHRNVKFISYFTVKPDKQSLLDYTQEFNEKIDGKKKYDLWLLGHKTKDLNGQKLNKNFTVFSQLSEFLVKLETLKKS
ncbi:MAG: MerR family transcriptional regulator [Flavobacterium sp.]|nr:MAG: MerR family transcriptional regulator [Flavobacterium sp.]